MSRSSVDNALHIQCRTAPEMGASRSPRATLRYAKPHSTCEQRTGLSHKSVLESDHTLLYQSNRDTKPHYIEFKASEILDVIRDSSDIAIYGIFPNRYGRVPTFNERRSDGQAWSGGITLILAATYADSQSSCGSASLLHYLSPTR